jgi:hypothetical protein
MTFVTINGIPIQCTAAEQEPVRLGEIARAFNGYPRGNYRGDYKTVTCSSTLLTATDAARVRALVEGRGHVWGFDGAFWRYSYTGVGPLYEGGISQDSGGLYGGGCLQVITPGVVAWRASERLTDWTIMGWRDTEIGWRHVIRRGPPYNDVWTDGNSGGLGGTLSDDWLMYDEEEGLITDDVVFLPYVIPDDWLPLLYNFAATRQFPTLPLIVVSGPAFDAGGTLCRGEVMSGTYGNKWTAGQAVVSETFAFRLHTIGRAGA